MKIVELELTDQEYEVLSGLRKSGLWGLTVSETAVRILDAWFIAHSEEIFDLNVNLSQIIRNESLRKTSKGQRMKLGRG